MGHGIVWMFFFYMELYEKNDDHNMVYPPVLRFSETWLAEKSERNLGFTQFPASDV